MATVAAILAVALGGALGASLRYIAEVWGVRRLGTAWPYGTFTVNMLGSLILGGLTGLALVANIPHTLSLFLGMGFCGALTTFSSFALQIADLARGDEQDVGALSVRSFSYAAVSLGLGLLCAAAIPLFIG